MHTKFHVKRAYNEEMKNQKLIDVWADFLQQFRKKKCNFTLKSRIANGKTSV